MTCLSCGQSLIGDEAFCRHCGARVVTAPSGRKAQIALGLAIASLVFAMFSSPVPWLLAFSAAVAALVLGVMALRQGTPAREAAIAALVLAALGFVAVAGTAVVAALGNYYGSGLPTVPST